MHVISQMATTSVSPAVILASATGGPQISSVVLGGSKFTPCVALIGLPTQSHEVTSTAAVVTFFVKGRAAAIHVIIATFELCAKGILVHKR